MAARKLYSIENAEHPSFANTFVYDYGDDIVHIETDEMVMNLNKWRNQKLSETPSKHNQRFGDYLSDVVKGSFRPQKFADAVEEGDHLLAGHEDLINRLEESIESVVASSNGKLKRPTIAQIAKLMDNYDSPATRRVLSSRTKNNVSSDEIQPSSSMENKMFKEFDRVVEKSSGMKDKSLTELDFGINKNTIRPDLDPSLSVREPHLKSRDEKNKRLTASDFGITADMVPPSILSKSDRNRCKESSERSEKTKDRLSASDFGITADMRPPSLSDLTPRKNRKTNMDCGTVVKSRIKSDPLVDFGKELNIDENEKLSEDPAPVMNDITSKELMKFDYLNLSKELTPADFGIDENTINPMELVKNKKVDMSPSLSFTPVKLPEKENVIPNIHHTRQDLDFLTPVKATRVFSEDFINTPDKNDQNGSFNLRNITIDDETGNPMEEAQLTIKFKGFSSPFEIMEKDHGLKKVTEEEFLTVPSYRRFGLDVTKTNQALFSLYKNSSGSKTHMFKLDELTLVESKAMPTLQMLGRISRQTDGCFHLI